MIKQQTWTVELIGKIVTVSKTVAAFADIDTLAIASPLVIHIANLANCKA